MFTRKLWSVVMEWCDTQCEFGNFVSVGLAVLLSLILIARDGSLETCNFVEDVSKELFQSA